MRLTAVLVVAVCVGLPALAADSPKKSKGERMICKHVQVTGSHRRQKICMKREQWQEASKRSRDDMDRVRQHESHQSGGGEG